MTIRMHENEIDVVETLVRRLLTMQTADLAEVVRALLTLSTEGGPGRQQQGPTAAGIQRLDPPSHRARLPLDRRRRRHACPQPGCSHRSGTCRTAPTARGTQVKRAHNLGPGTPSTVTRWTIHQAPTRTEQRRGRDLISVLEARRLPSAHYRKDGVEAISQPESANTLAYRDRTHRIGGRSGKVHISIRQVVGAKCLSGNSA